MKLKHKFHFNMEFQLQCYGEKYILCVQTVAFDVLLHVQYMCLEFHIAHGKKYIKGKLKRLFITNVVNVFLTLPILC